jgi:predicted DNA-binding ribbon-helix-helix protein
MIAGWKVRAATIAASAETSDSRLGWELSHRPFVTVSCLSTKAHVVSRPVKRSFTIAGHRTSISLEAPFWEALKTAACEDRIPVSGLIAHIDAGREGCGLSSAVRVWVLSRCRQRSGAA